jgi:hypothetical protein
LSQIIVFALISIKQLLAKLESIGERVHVILFQRKLKANEFEKSTSSDSP